MSTPAMFRNSATSQVLSRSWRKLFSGGRKEFYVDVGANDPVLDPRPCPCPGPVRNTRHDFAQPCGTDPV